MSGIAVFWEELVEIFRQVVVSEAFSAALAAASAWVAMFASVSMVRRLVQSNKELELAEENDQLRELRRKISKEKDEEAKRRLREQAELLQERFAREPNSSLREQNGSPTDDWREVLILARQRLFEETDRLVARSASNLSFGVVAAAFGIICLVLVVFMFPPDSASESVGGFLSNYGPRLSIVLIIELLAVFFLRMYSRNERDIFRNKNEITNIEFRMAAGLMLMSNNGQISELAKYLAVEERNFIVVRDEKTTRIDGNKLVEASGSLMEKTIESARGGSR